MILPLGPNATHAHRPGSIMQPRAVIATLALAGQFVLTASAPAETQLAVYKQTSCTCCDLWVEGIRHSGFGVTVHNVSDVSPYRRNLGVAEQYRSCHTAFVEQAHQVIEGHVPAADIGRLVGERTDGAILAVPGMPHGSPGMEAYDKHRNPYKVLYVDGAGDATLDASYPEAAGSAHETASRSGRIVDVERHGTDEYVVKAVWNGLLALLLGAGVMGLAHVHCRHLDKRAQQRGRVKSRGGRPKSSSVPARPRFSSGFWRRSGKQARSAAGTRGPSQRGDA